MCEKPSPKDELLFLREDTTLVYKTYTTYRTGTWLPTTAIFLRLKEYYIRFTETCLRCIVIVIAIHIILPTKNVY
jgi:hypothetical protein